MTWDDAFEAAGYYPTLCRNHEQAQAVNRDPISGDMLCTAGCKVLPVVRDDEDRIGQKLRELETRA